MKHSRWHIVMVVTLVLLSALIYGIQLMLFNKPGDTFFYMFQDIAFVPIQVLIVTLIIERLLSERERVALIKKMNMLVGAFYSEVGNDLIRHCAKFSADLEGLAPHLLVSPAWSQRDFEKAMFLVNEANPGIDACRSDLQGLDSFLAEKRGFLLSLLANPNLLEHDSFTDLLWAVFHLLEELGSRESFSELPKSDSDHLSGDIRRAFTRLLAEWLSYMQHLKQDYPYLFSLAVRMNPLDQKAAAVIRD